MNRPLGRPTSWPAPGKLNLFLHVVRRRPDGYHELQTAFQFMGRPRRTRSHFFQRPPGVIERLGVLPGVAAEDDLVVRAARLLAAAAAENGVPVRSGVAIAVEKRLPIGGGVGGGSSNAATTLVALNQLWEMGFDGKHLAELGLRLGADVPVFVHGNAAWLKASAKGWCRSTSLSRSTCCCSPMSPSARLKCSKPLN